jgi:DNA-binding MarR family transcriptional regulator
VSASFDSSEADLSLAALFAGWALADVVQRRLAEEGYADVRFADGLVFQHLIGGPRAIGALAERLGVSQQAASKSVADLERRGYVRRVPDPSDGRARLAALTERGEAVVGAARRHRAALAGELAHEHGAERVEDARKLLLDVLATTGGEAPVRARRVRPPR